MKLAQGSSIIRGVDDQSYLKVILGENMSQSSLPHSYI